MTDWSGWSPRERAVLVFLQQGDQMLLIHKKRGLGKGKVNGPGGRLEPGETWEQAARRETREETGLLPGILTLGATLKFLFVDGYSLEVQAFITRDGQGQLTACDEADPFWHPSAQLPWGRMWADDALWLPPVLGGAFVDARFLFDADTMCEAEIVVRHRPTGPISG